MGVGENINMLFYMKYYSHGKKKVHPLSVERIYVSGQDKNNLLSRS